MYKTKETAIKRLADGENFKNKVFDLFRDDKEVVLAAIKCDGRELIWASDRLKDDPEVVLAAVKDCGISLDHASDRLKSDKGMVETALMNGFPLMNAKEEFKSDLDLVRIAVKDYAFQLDWTQEDIKGNREVVFDLVQNINPWCFQFASEELKDDKDLALIAINKDSELLEYASDRLKNDKEVALAVLLKDSDMLNYISEEIQQLVGDSPNPAAKLQSLIEKEKLEAKMAARGININKERDNDVGFAL